MSISRIRGSKSEVLRLLNELILKGENILARSEKNEEFVSLESSWISWRHTTHNTLQFCFSDDSMASSFWLHFSGLGESPGPADQRKALVRLLKMSVDFIRNLSEDVRNGLHDSSDTSWIDPAASLAILKRVLSNFHLHLQTMYHSEVHKKGKITQASLQQIQIENEYDVQRVLFSLIRPIFPEARMEVPEDAGYGSVRYDIIMDELRTAVEVKCTRANMNERSLTEELGSDAFHYQTDNLFFFIYDKHRIIRNADAFTRAYSRETTLFGKNIETFIIQPRPL